MIALVNPHSAEQYPVRPKRTNGCEVAQTIHQAEVQRLARLRAGDRDAAEALVNEYGGRMLAVARRMLRSEDDAADAVQDAFLSAFTSIHRFRASSQLYTWLHRIVVNACLMKLRSRKGRNTISVDELLPTIDESGRHPCPIAAQPGLASESIERAETRAQVRSCVNRLPDDQRSILILRDFEELDTNTTAATLGISQAAVKTRLHRARQALRTMLEYEFVIEA
jgi:RNA polymerase sigma-70 factor (ECF subfamily)